MALTTDERERLATALAETPGALEALALLGTEAGAWPFYDALANTLVDEAAERAGVPRPAAEDVGRAAYPLIERLPAVQSYAPVFAAHRARGGGVPPVPDLGPALAC